MSEVSMWLFPVAVAAVVGLFMSARFGIRWTWGICLQQFLMMVACIFGFVFLYAPLDAPYAVNREQYAAGCTVIAWAMFLTFNLWQRILISQLSLDLSLFRVQQALGRAKLVRLVTWGPPGQYWTDISNALNLYNLGRVQEGDAIVEKWHQDRRMPVAARESLVGFFMLGRVLLHDWQGIIDEFQKNQNTLSESRSFVPYQMACRAYAELGRFPEAEECLRKANMQPAKTTATNLDINFMTLFALFGALPQLRGVFSRCRDYRALPLYVRNYWLGRCHSVRGDAANALQALVQCKHETPAKMETWHKRIDQELAAQERVIEAGMFPPDRSADEELSNRAEQLYLRLRMIVEVLRPSTARHAVVGLLVALVVAYIASNCDQFLIGILPQAQLVSFHNQCYLLGELSARQLLKGEFWRTITYLFLHGNTAHLLMNAFALYLFGKNVENTYGTGRFLIIFFGSGILSGIMQITLVPTDAAIGASGAILGVFGAATAGIIKLKHVLPAPIRKAELRWMASIAIAQVVFDQVVNGIAAATDKSPDGVRIAAFAHLGGMIAGFAIGMLLPTRKFKSDGR
jgi:membrane associated rhomboid family serine protease